MSWHKKTMKDAATCDKPRVGGSNLESVDFRMGKPNHHNRWLLPPEYIRWIERTQGSETSQYLEEKKTKVIP